MLPLAIALHLAIPHIIEQKWGCIINITSVVGLSGWPGERAYAYVDTGLVGFTKSLAKVPVPKGITVNAVTKYIRFRPPVPWSFAG